MDSEKVRNGEISQRAARIKMVLKGIEKKLPKVRKDR